MAPLARGQSKSSELIKLDSKMKDDNEQDNASGLNGCNVRNKQQ